MDCIYALLTIWAKHTEQLGWTGALAAFANRTSLELQSLPGSALTSDRMFYPGMLCGIFVRWIVGLSMLHSIAKLLDMQIHYKNPQQAPDVLLPI